MDFIFDLFSEPVCIQVAEILHDSMCILNFLDTEGKFREELGELKRKEKKTEYFLPHSEIIITTINNRYQL